MDRVWAPGAERGPLERAHQTVPSGCRPRRHDGSTHRAIAGRRCRPSSVCDCAGRSRHPAPSPEQGGQVGRGPRVRRPGFDSTGGGYGAPGAENRAARRRSVSLASGATRLGPFCLALATHPVGIPSTAVPSFLFLLEGVLPPPAGGRGQPSHHEHDRKDSEYEDVEHRQRLGKTRGTVTVDLRGSAACVGECVEVIRSPGRPDHRLLGPTPDR